MISLCFIKPFLSLSFSVLMNSYLNDNENCVCGKEEERKLREPEASTTPAPEAAGAPSGADEMDVVVTENSAMASIAGQDQANRTSITDTVSRLVITL